MPAPLAAGRRQADPTRRASRSPNGPDRRRSFPPGCARDRRCAGSIAGWRWPAHVRNATPARGSSPADARPGPPFAPPAATRAEPTAEPRRAASPPCAPRPPPRTPGCCAAPAAPLPPSRGVNRCARPSRERSRRRRRSPRRHRRARSTGDARRRPRPVRRTVRRERGSPRRFFPRISAGYGR